MLPAHKARIFAYGSNMRLARIRQRVASAEALTIGYVEQHQLAMHKRSQDGSAKADAWYTGNSSDRVFGVVYCIDVHEKPLLDACEFLGTGYDETEIDVVCPSGVQKAWMYVARPEALDPNLFPYDWYRQYLIQGAVEHRLPECYIQLIRSFRARMDPDQERRKSNLALCYC
ncbi:MAG: gamma-glutamylcyclotransferase [bacterium]|nr:gamma-glutamylcyclotransferase [bacterium]